VAPPPADGSRGCVATIRRPVRGAGHIVWHGLSASGVGWVGGLGGLVGAVHCHLNEERGRLTLDDDSD
jgi:hypothetical protein